MQADWRTLAPARQIVSMIAAQFSQMQRYPVENDGFNHS
jgi:hypothetical protein